MKRLFFAACAAIVLFLCPLAARAEEASAFITGSKTGDILFTDLALVGVGGLGITANFLLMGALGSDGKLSLTDRLIASSMTELADIPLFALRAPEATPTALLGAGLLGAELLSASAGGESVSLTDYFYWTKFDLSLYKMYAAYAIARSRSAAWNNVNFKRYSLAELYAAPLDIRHLSRPLLWASVGTSLGLFALSLALTETDDQSVWKTGKWYIGNGEANPAAFILANSFLKTSYSFTVGVGEEAFYRGFLYEEMSQRLNRTWAKAIDAVAFTATHLITDLVRGMDWRYIIVHVAGIAANTLFLDGLYDEGGLPASVAAHAWVDALALNFQPYYFGGAPVKNRRWPNAALSIGWNFAL